MKKFTKFAVTAPTVAGLALLANGISLQTVSANELDQAQTTLEQINNYSNNGSLDQVTSVNQLSDVSPTDWAYEALRNLVERYGCIAGYPDRTFRGNRALSRYEFAAGLNACMQQIERLVSTPGGGGVNQGDLASLQRLVGEFETELTTLGARVDNLEGKVAFLEDHQFSTTTKLSGEVIFALVGQNDTAGGQITLSDRVRLTLDSSFTGKDRLRLRLAAGNIPDLGAVVGTNLSPTNMNRLNFQQNTGNNVLLDRAYYRTPLFKNGTLYAGTEMPAEDIFTTYNPYMESSGGGALSRFNRFNPLIYRQPGAAGIGYNQKFGKRFDFTASYLAGNGANPADGNGLFDGTYSAIAQIGFNPTDNWKMGFAYARSYFGPGDVNVSGSTTSGRSRRPFGNAVATSSDNFGYQTTFRVNKRINLAGWVGFSNANAEDGIGGNADLFTWNANVSFLDAFKEGAVLTIAGGQPPKVTGGSRNNIGLSEPDTSFILEGQYKYPISKNVSITPGVIAVFNPENNNANATNIIGVLRTRFTF